MNVAFSLDAEELKRFDDWRSSFNPPLARGPALVMLLNSYDTDSLMAVARVVESPTLEKSENAEVVDPAEIAKAVKAEALRQALRMTEKRVGVKPVTIEGDRIVKPDPDGWEDPP